VWPPNEPRDSDARNYDEAQDELACPDITGQDDSRPLRLGRGGTCCWKPRGCTMTEEQGCRLMQHPIKRAMRGDPQAPCPMGWVEGDVPMTCGLLNDHEGDCAPAPSPS
jgi:hypothetical protein